VLPARVPAEYRRTWPDADYTVFYPMNDNVQAECIEAMLDAYRTLGRKDDLDAAMRCAEFLLLAQLPEPHRGWAQQFDHDMIPARAVLRTRNEPPDLRRYRRESARVASRPDRLLVAKRLQYLRRHRTLRTGPEQGPRRPPPRPEKAAAPGQTRVAGDDAIASCDQAGRWITRESYPKGDPPEDFITTRAYIARMNILGNYLARIEPAAPSSAGRKQPCASLIAARLPDHRRITPGRDFAWHDP
jgi:hypothetical protein